MLRNISRFPTFMLLALASRNSCKARGIQMMFSTKLLEAMNKIFSAIGRSDNIRFRVRWSMSKSRLTYLLSRLRTALLAYSCLCSIVLMFFSLLVANSRKSCSLYLFRGGFPSDASARFALLCIAYSLTCFKRPLHSQMRASNGGNIKEWVKSINPMLLASSQHLRNKDQFQDFEGERLSTVLIPSVLHLWVFMLVTLHFSEMVVSTPSKIYRTSDIELACNSTGDLVNTRCDGDESGHISNCLSLVPWFFLLPGEQGYSLFSAIDRITDRQRSNYIFFHTACKAEERG